MRFALLPLSRPEALTAEKLVASVDICKLDQKNVNLLATEMFRLVLSKFLACCFPKKKTSSPKVKTNLLKQINPENPYVENFELIPQVKTKSLKQINAENPYGEDLELIPTIVLHPPCSSSDPPRSEIDSIATKFIRVLLLFITLWEQGGGGY